MGDHDLLDYCTFGLEAANDAQNIRVDTGAYAEGGQGGLAPPQWLQKKMFLTWTVQTEMSIICPSFSDSHVGS